MNAHRVIRHTSDEDESTRWASRGKQRGGPVEIASGPAPLVASAGWTGLPRQLGEGSFSSPGWRGRSVKSKGFEAERWFRGRCIGSREGVFGFNMHA